MKNKFGVFVAVLLLASIFLPWWSFLIDYKKWSGGFISPNLLVDITVTYHQFLFGQLIFGPQQSLGGFVPNQPLPILPLLLCFVFNFIAAILAFSERRRFILASLLIASFVLGFFYFVASSHGYNIFGSFADSYSLSRYPYGLIKFSTFWGFSFGFWFTLIAIIINTIRIIQQYRQSKTET